MSDITNSDSFQILFAGATRLLIQLPTLIVMVVGIILALQNMRKHPNTSRSALIAFSILIVSNIIFSGISAWMPYAIFENTGDVELIGWISVGLGIVGNVIAATAYIFLVMAIFRWRGAEEQVTPERALPRPYDVASNQYGAGPGPNR